jgi:hypothetical protein
VCVSRFLVSACSRSSAENIDILGAQSSAEEEVVLDLYKQARRVLSSDEFFENMGTLRRAYPTVFVKRGEPDIALEHAIERIPRRVSEPRAIARIPRRVSGPRYVQTTFRLVGERDGAGPDREFAGTARVGLFGLRSRIIIGRGILEQYISQDRVDKSCAVNAMAHEMSHTISIHPIFYIRAFEDSRTSDEGIVGRDENSYSPISSYLIGTVAQCTYLQIDGIIRSDELRDCVRVFGTRSFNDKRCRAFSDGKPVAPSVDLPEANQQF